MPSCNQLDLVYENGMLSIFSDSYAGEFSLSFVDIDTAVSYEVYLIKVWKKELFSSDELSELEALEVRGGNTASIMAQSKCVNNNPGCGPGVEQDKCVNKTSGCGAHVIIIQDPCKDNKGWL